MTTIELSPDLARSLRHIALMAWTDLETDSPLYKHYEEIFFIIKDAVPYTHETK